MAPSTGSLPKAHKSYPNLGEGDGAGSDAYQTKKQQYESHGVRHEGDLKHIQDGREQREQVAQRARDASPRPSAPVRVVNIPESSAQANASAQAAEVQKSKQNNMRSILDNMDAERRLEIERESAVTIQKWVRGHIARTSGRKQKEINFKQMRKLRRMLSVAYGKTRTKLVKQLLHVLKESGTLHCDQNYQLWKKYQAHCATLIQRHWRGYSLRYLQIDQFNEKVWRNKRNRLLAAVVKGYRTRLLLHPDGYHQGIHRVRMDIMRVTNQDNGKAIIIDVNDRLTLKNLMKRRRQKVIELIRIFNRTSQTQGIIVQLLQQKRRLENRGHVKHLQHDRDPYAAGPRPGDSSKISNDPSQKSLRNVSTLLDYGTSQRAGAAHQRPKT